MVNQIKRVMKELSMEEKAKAYDEALHKAKRIINVCVDDNTECRSMTACIQQIFPELKESEDERIRKAIKLMYSFLPNEPTYIGDVPVKDIFAWLEKQGEKVKPIEGFDTEFERQVSCLIASAMNKDYEYTKDFVKWTSEGLLNYAKREFEKNSMGISEATKKKLEDNLNKALEKETPESWNKFLDEQGEQKPAELTNSQFVEKCKGLSDLEKYILSLVPTRPIDAIKVDARTIRHLVEQEQKFADKLEPKIKVGDWISGYYTNYKVLSVNNEGYVVEDVDGNKINILFENEKFHHLWTIQDAKDGDVISWDDSKCIALFKNIYDEESFNSYGFVGHCTGTFELRQSYHDIEGAHPATKEQRDLLFQKMKEAGYEWDAAKKELKKIEQLPIDVRTTGYWLVDDVEQKPWSEEDGAMFNFIALILRNHQSDENFTTFETTFKDCIDWLKSLKERYTWKPSDYQMETLKYACGGNYVDLEVLESLYNDLKKLRG